MTSDTGDPRIDALGTTVYVVPTDRPESDGTLTWDRTTMVVVRVTAGEHEGIGYSYTSAGGRSVIDEILRPEVLGKPALSTPALWSSMQRAVRNIGPMGLAVHALSAVDIALWDLKAKLLNRT